MTDCQFNAAPLDVCKCDHGRMLARIAELEVDVEHLTQFLIDAKAAMATARADALREAGDKAREVCQNIAKGWEENPGKDNSGSISAHNCAMFAHAAILALINKETTT